MNLDYTRITSPQLLEDWTNRLLADERFSGLSQASIYQYFQELIAGITDMSNFYMGRVAEEAFQCTARLDSSHIKHAKNFGYQPRRSVPATAEIKVVLHGPLPTAVRAGDRIWFNRSDLNLSFNGHDYLLDHSYSYEFTQEDIEQGADAGWTKTLLYSRDARTNQSDYYVIDDRTTLLAKRSLYPIGIFQGTIKTVEIRAVDNANKVGTVNQWYDIDDTTFSNYYGTRDPFAFQGSTYSPSYGLCKIGIGIDADEAFTKNICDIEILASELNSRLKSWNTSKEPLNIVHVESNPDKTVRIHFGNGNNIAPGFTNTKQSLWVQYLSCDGAAPNKADTIDSQLQCQNKIYACGRARVVNITNNVKFLLNTGITGGEDFESQNKLKLNSRLFFASRGNLLTLADFQGYFQTLTTPFVVNHALAFGENQYDTNNTDSPWMTNNILYCLFGDIYHNYSTGRYSPVNVFDPDEKLDNVMLYNTKERYESHLFDMVKLRLFQKTFRDRQYKDNTIPFSNIRENCEDRMLLNTNLLSMPPIFHYYDIVGTVVVDKHKDMATYSAEVEDQLYGWLNSNVSFGTKVYKSDISNKLHELAATKKTNIDVRVSSLLTGDSVTNTYLNNDCTWTYDIANASADYKLALSAENGRWYYTNVLKLPRYDEQGNELGTPSELKGTQLMFSWDIDSDGSLKEWTSTTEKWQTVETVTMDENFLYIKLLGDGVQAGGGRLGPSRNPNACLRITRNMDSYMSEGNYTTISSDFRDALTEWLDSKLVKEGTKERPIELPYIIDAIETNVRTETMTRRGANDTTLNGLNENAFLDFVANYVSNRIASTATVDSFTQFEPDLRSVYPLLKAAFSDSLLDDNNNIVNFSSAQEIPVLRVQLEYVYEE